jgi:uncharacterized membrane-anchored protein
MEIKNYRDINKGCLKSAFTVVIPEWGEAEVDCTYFEKESGSFWVNYASKEYTTKDGQKKSHNQVRWPKAVIDRLNKAIREKIKTGKVEHKAPPAYAAPAEPIMDESELPF